MRSSVFKLVPVIFAMLVCVSGCKYFHAKTPEPGVSPDPFVLESSGFVKNVAGLTGPGAGSPDLSWGPVPRGADSLVLTLDNLDIPGRSHWLVADIPATRTFLPRGLDAVQKREIPPAPERTAFPTEKAFAAAQQEYATTVLDTMPNSQWRFLPYSVPAEDSDHRYRFTLFAVKGFMDFEAFRGRLEPNLADRVQALFGTAGICGKATLDVSFRTGVLQPDAPGDQNAPENPEPPVEPVPFQLTSPAFQEGEAIPVGYTEEAPGGGVSPEFTWGDAPEGTESLILTMDDLDAPGFPHWFVANIPPESRGLPRGHDNTQDALLPPWPVREEYATNEEYDVAWNERLALSFTHPNDEWPFISYFGPMPPTLHRYQFRIFAITGDFDFEAFRNQGGTTMAERVEALLGADRILDSKTLVGTYTPADPMFP